MCIRDSNHTDQPLMMIKPKGRPSTTCDFCKQLRKNKNASPEGACTCGRLEKKKLAQKAKEEARAKSKEKQRKQCTCGTDELCKYHAQKRHSRTVSYTHLDVYKRQLLYNEQWYIRKVVKLYSFILYIVLLYR